MIHTRKNLAAKLLATALLSVSTVHAESVNPIPTVTDGYRFLVTPYLWAAGISGNVDCTQ